jgi:hypothetical protein
VRRPPFRHRRPTLVVPDPPVSRSESRVSSGRKLSRLVGGTPARAMAAGCGLSLLLFTAALLVGLASASPFISGAFPYSVTRCSLLPRSLASASDEFVPLCLNRQRVPGERRIYGEKLAAGQEEYVLRSPPPPPCSAPPSNAYLFWDLF